MKSINHSSWEMGQMRWSRMQILLGVLHIKAIVRPTGHWHRKKNQNSAKKLSLLIKLHVGLKLFTSEISYKDISVTFLQLYQ